MVVAREDTTFVFTVGKRIRELRQREGWDQKELAKRVGVSRPTISKWERDESEPKLSQADKLADIFKVTLQSLTSGYRHDSAGQRLVAPVPGTGRPSKKRPPQVESLQGIRPLSSVRT